MTRQFSSRRNYQIIHWFVLVALMLGQLTLGLGTGVAAQQGRDEIRVPVCTTTGIQYLVWTSDGVTKETGTTTSTAAGTCVLCTVSPSQLQFDLQDGLLPKYLQSLNLQITTANRIVRTAAVLNVTAPPRAPPIV